MPFRAAPRPQMQPRDPGGCPATVTASPSRSQTQSPFDEQRSAPVETRGPPGLRASRCHRATKCVQVPETVDRVSRAARILRSVRAASASVPRDRAAAAPPDLRRTSRAAVRGKATSSTESPIEHREVAVIVRRRGCAMVRTEPAGSVPSCVKSSRLPSMRQAASQSPRAARGPRRARRRCGRRACPRARRMRQHLEVAVRLEPVLRQTVERDQGGLRRVLRADSRHGGPCRSVDAAHRIRPRAGITITKSDRGPCRACRSPRRACPSLAAMRSACSHASGEFHATSMWPAKMCFHLPFVSSNTGRSRSRSPRSAEVRLKPVPDRDDLRVIRDGAQDDELCSSSSAPFRTAACRTQPCR